jgi:septal ring factor EnvC (AmiA/AmiB activator)
MAQMDRDRVQDHRRKLEALRSARARVQQRSENVMKLQGEASAARVSLERAIRTRNARVAAIDRQRDLNAQLTGELQDAQRRLQASIANLAAGRPAAERVMLPIEPFRGELPRPVAGRIRTTFGRQPGSRSATSINRSGIEFEAEEGDAVAAVHEGTVAFAGPFTGFGNLVILQHSTVEGREDFSLYGHLDTMAVKKGDTLERQRQVGTVGRTPTGKAALYFELRIDGRPVDPLQWLKR